MTPPTLHAARAVLPNLDGIRALACLLVVLSHMPWPVPTGQLGFVGVGVFFVLSGFLMSHLYAAAPWDGHSVCRYAIARFSRIAPIYWLVISACILISYLGPEEEFSLRIEGMGAIVRHYLLGGNVQIFWSIPVEVQYYLFFVLVWWAYASRMRLAYAVPLLVLCSGVLMVTHTLWSGLMLPHKLHFFVAGTLAGLAPRPVWQERDLRVLSLLQVAALALLSLHLWLLRNAVDWYAASDLAASMGLAVYLLSLPSPWTRRVLACAPMRLIGQASFSIYLMHLLVFHYGMRLLGLQHAVYEPLWLLLGMAGVLLPLLVSRIVEIPLQRYTRRTLEYWLLNQSHPIQPQSA